MNFQPLRRWSCLLLLLPLLAPVVRLSAQEDVAFVSADPIDASAFLRSPLIQTPDLNQAGTHVAALYSGGGETYQLMIKEVGSPKEPVIVGGSGQVQVSSFRWLDDQHVAYTLNVIGGSQLGLMVVDINNPAGAYPVYQYGASQIIGVPSGSPMKPLVWVSVAGAEGTPAVVEIDASLNTGGFIDVRGDDADAAWAKVAEHNNDHILRVVPVPAGRTQLGYLADAEGNLGFAYTATDERVVLHVWDGANWIASGLNLAGMSVVDVGRQVGELLVRLPPQDGETAGLFFIDALTGEVGDLVLRDKDYDFEGTTYRDPASKAIVGAFYDRAGPTNHWFDEAYRKLQEVLNDFFPGRAVRMIDASVKGDVQLVAVSSDRHPVEFYTVNLTERTVGLLASVRPWLDPELMRPTSVVKYTTADGKKLDAYVTLPTGASKDSPVPLVVLPHGGPWARNTWGFDPEVQALASRGFAVLQPNYRGSTGYDWMFTEAERNDFLMMRVDISRAVKTVLRTGMIDEKRVAISGGGFGGYLAVSSLVEDPNLYAAGVTFAGIYDWARAANTLGVDRERDPNYGEHFAVLGDPGREAAKYGAVSPSKRVDRIKAPLLVIEQLGADTVEQDEASRLIAELKSAGAPYETLSLQDGAGSLANRVKLFEGIEAFLQKHL